MEMQECWEFMKCGREVAKSCAAVVKNAGSICWMVAGTMCGGKPQGTFVEKVSTCKNCDFYQYVQEFKNRKDA